MLPQETLGRVLTPDGAELVLYCRDGVYTIRVNGMELMSSRVHGSEDSLARLAWAQLDGRHRPRVLVGGLGMGFTLRTALDCLPAGAEVVVAEVFEAVVGWCRGPLAGVAGHPLEDHRVVVEACDVWRVLERDGPRFDAVLLDVDNGPQALTLSTNSRLYRAAGLQRIKSRLTAGGVLAVWSAAPEPRFGRELARAGFEVRTETVRARPGSKGPRHTVFLATHRLPTRSLRRNRSSRRR